MGQHWPLGPQVTNKCRREGSQQTCVCSGWFTHCGLMEEKGVGRWVLNSAHQVRSAWHSRRGKRRRKLVIISFQQYNKFNVGFEPPPVDAEKARVCHVASSVDSTYHGSHKHLRRRAARPARDMTSEGAYPAQLGLTSLGSARLVRSPALVPAGMGGAGTQRPARHSPGAKTQKAPHAYGV